MFKRVLVANRGEIARRIIRSCDRLGVATVAVYSEADKDALHVAEADEAHWIGAPPVAASYLDIERLIQVARETASDAIHPGYGLLSERADFVEAVEAAGLVFIGPPAQVMATTGSKLASRRAAIAAEVPVLPASGPVSSDDPEGLLAAGEAVGYPLLVKLSAGGGGIGMTRVERPEKLVKAAKKAARRGESAFGDGTLYLERAVDRGRHVEVQVLCDRYGKTLHVFERDCSVQRRHQKVIEEAPAPGLSPELRAAITAAAVRLAKSVDYCNAGTVEFLLQGSEFWFLEMNARIQVEHPVTEEICRIDLVEWQLRIAAGEALDLEQDDLRPQGHAIELRIYAEDPTTFFPAPGRIETFTEPSGEGLRFDHSMASGMDVTPFYDPMLGKLVLHAADRDLAIERCLCALQALQLDGITHNVPLHQEVLSSELFRSGGVHTGLIDELRRSSC